MKKKKEINIKRKNEIRYHNVFTNEKRKKRHPAYIWNQRGNVYDYHSLTHSHYVNGEEYEELDINPKPGDNRKSYFNPKSQNDIKSSFGRKEKWKLSKSDRIKIDKMHKKR